MLEMASVIVGVLIALAVSEAAQNWHWAADVAEARTGIQEEIRYNNDWLAFRVMLRPCLDVRLARATDAVEALAAGTAKAPVAMPDWVTGGRIDDQNWQALRSSATFEHFANAERQQLSAYYSQLSDLKAWVAEESDAWYQLSLVQYRPETIERGEFSRMRVALMLARSRAELISRNAVNQLARARPIVGTQLFAKAQRYRRLVTRLQDACASESARPQDIGEAMRSAEP